MGHRDESVHQRLSLRFSRGTGRGLTVLCLGAHSDDVEIGCGGTVLKLIEEQEDLFFYWVVFSSDKSRRKEAQRSARAFLAGTRNKIIVKEFRDGFLPYDGRRIKEYFEGLKREFSPDLIFTHYRSDLHQDHRLISDLTWNTFRDHMILEYEIPKYDGDLGSPNVFVQLKDSIRNRKIRYLLDYFDSQRGKPWFTQETFNALMRLRGIESNSPHGYAEAFYCRKLILQ